MSRYDEIASAVKPRVQLRYKAGDFFVSVNCSLCTSFCQLDGEDRCFILDGRRVYDRFGCMAFAPRDVVKR